MDEDYFFGEMMKTNALQLINSSIVTNSSWSVNERPGMCMCVVGFSKIRSVSSMKGTSVSTVTVPVLAVQK